jgi:hypothetical protein
MTHVGGKNFSKKKRCIARIFGRSEYLKRHFYAKNRYNCSTNDAAILAAVERYLSRNKVIGSTLG